ncbi:MAG TPA: hypothetical protein VD867_01150 [Burkholderiales bacterium]|nr:hypothetical protein [Burkholderiales bacterium]
MSWSLPLTYVVTPKSGPLRQLTTLADARSALIEDLPIDRKKTPHWLDAGLRLVEAGESGDPDAIETATEALVQALDAEGWLARQTD